MKPLDTIETLLEKADKPPKVGKPTWWHRRQMMTYTLLFCAACILYSMIEGKDTVLAQTIVMSCFSLGGSIISVYIGARVWQDINVKKIDAVLESSKAASEKRTSKASKEDDINVKDIPKEFLTEE